MNLVGSESRDSKSGEVLDLCQPFLDACPISGASVTVFNASGAQSALCASDKVAALIDELQFDLGEGPQWAAIRSGETVMIPDVGEAAHDDWPVFGAALTQLPVGAIFCIPLRMGAVTVGAATLYRDKAIDLSEEQRLSAVAIASAISSSAVQRAMRSATDSAENESETMPALRREVHQATGMILVQLDSSASEAYLRLKAYAFAQGRTVQSVAHDVVTRALTFEGKPHRAVNEAGE